MPNPNWTKILPGAVFAASEWVDHSECHIPTCYIDLKQNLPDVWSGKKGMDQSHHSLIEVHGNEQVRDAIVEFLNSKDFGQHFEFHKGDRVRKVGSYTGDGEVIIAFKANGHSRYVVAHTLQGGEGQLLHIYGDKELEHQG